MLGEVPPNRVDKLPVILYRALQPPDMGWATTRFVIQVELTALEEISELGLTDGETLAWTHVDLDADTQAGTLWAEFGGGGITVADGAYTIQLPAGELSGTAVCIEETLWASPDDFLLEFLE